MIIPEHEWDRAAAVPGANDCTGPSRANPTLSPQSLSPGEPPSYNDSVDRRATSRSRNPSRSRSTRQEGSSGGGDRRVSRIPPSPRLNNTSVLEGGTDYQHSAATGPIVYTFVQQSHNAMVLMFQPLAIPLYHISVNTNVFIPSSQVTIIRRGDSEQGEFVAQFEMGVSVKKSTITLDGREKLTDSILFKAKSRSDRNWHWRWYNDENLSLSWSYDSPVKFCYLKHKAIGPDPPLLATFTPPPLTPRPDGRPSPPPILKIYPEGQAMFDHILISSLIIERKRLTPSSSLALMSWSV